MAASATWTGAEDALWSNVDNWTASPVPNNADTATFNTNVANGTTTPIDLGTGRTIKTVIIDGGAGAYVFGAAASPGLTLQTGGLIETRADVLNAQRFDAQLFLSASSGAATVASNALSTSAVITLAGGVGTIGTSTTNTLHLNGSNTGNNVVSGVIANHASTATVVRVQKNGTGTWALTNANTYTGGTVLQGGTLKLDFNAAGAPASNILASTSTVTFGGVTGNNTLHLVGKQDAASTQTLTTWTTNLGAGHLHLQATGTGSMTLNLGSIGSTTRQSGATLDISLGANTFLTTTQATHTNGAMFQMVTLNGVTFAAKDGSNNIVPFTAYSLTTSSGLTSGNTAIMDVASGVDTTVLTAGTSTLGGLRFNQAESRTITLGTSRAMAVGGGNGPAAILVTPNVGANLSRITGGMVWGISSRDLMILQNNTQGELQIDSSITDVSIAQTMPLTKSGLGKLILTGRNAYRGSTILNEGTIVVTSDATFGNTQTLTTTGNSAVINGVDTTGLFVGQRVSGANVVGAGSTYAITAIGTNSVTLSTTVNTGLAATSSVTFSDGSGLGNATGATAIQIATGGKLQIGNGGTTGSLLDAAGIANGGTVAFNRSNNTLQFGSIISGAGDVSHDGIGKVTLTGVNTYTGETRITAGTLGLSGATNNIAGSNRIIVGTTSAQSGAVFDVTGVTSFALASGQTLAGYGSVNGAVNVSSGATVSPGASAGILTLNNGVAFAAGSTLAVEINGLTAGNGATNHDQLVISAGDAALAGTLDVDFGTITTEVGDRLLIVSNAGVGSTTGQFQFADNGVVGVANGVEWHITYNADGLSSLDGGNDVVLFAQPVPEPAAAGVMVLAAGALLRRRRQR